MERSGQCVARLLTVQGYECRVYVQEERGGLQVAG